MEDAEEIRGNIRCYSKGKSADVTVVKKGNSYVVGHVSCRNLDSATYTDDNGKSRKECLIKISTEGRDTYCDVYGKTMSYEWVQRARKRESAKVKGI